MTDTPTKIRSEGSGVWLNTPSEMFQYILFQAGSTSRKRVTGFASLLEAAEAAQREVDRSVVWDAFRVDTFPGSSVQVHRPLRLL